MCMNVYHVCVCNKIMYATIEITTLHLHGNISVYCVVCTEFMEKLDENAV